MVIVRDGHMAKTDVNYSLLLPRTSDNLLVLPSSKLNCVGLVPGSALVCR